MWKRCAGSALFFLAITSFCFADDKNGVSQNTISLPEGPGSIEELGKAFQPMLNTGSARYQIKIALPAGINGNTPQLSLGYDSGQGNGPLGIRWTFGSGTISRQTEKGIPRYVDGPNDLIYAAAYYMKENLRQAWNQPNKETAKDFLTNWVYRTDSSITPMLVKIAYKIANHFYGIGAYL